MRGLRGARGVGRRIFRPALGGLGCFRDEQELAVIEREPGLPLRVGNAGPVFQRLAERRQIVGQSGYFASSALTLARPGRQPVMSPTRCTTASQAAI